MKFVQWLATLMLLLIGGPAWAIVSSSILDIDWPGGIQAVHSAFIDQQLNAVASLGKAHCTETEAVAWGLPPGDPATILPAMQAEIARRAAGSGFQLTDLDPMPHGTRLSLATHPRRAKALLVWWIAPGQVTLGICGTEGGIRLRPLAWTALFGLMLGVVAGARAWRVSGPAQRRWSIIAGLCGLPFLLLLIATALGLAR